MKKNESEYDGRIRIKDWHKFQHFRDRKPPWIKLYRDILDDLQWHQLDPTAAKSLVMLWLIASEYDGALPDNETLCFRLRMTPNQLSAVLSKLSHWLEHLDANMISARYQDDLPETEREKRREEAEAVNPALSVTETRRQIALRRENLDVRPRTNFERSAAVTADAIRRVLRVPRKVDDGVHPRLPAANDRSNGVGVSGNPERPKPGRT